MDELPRRRGLLRNAGIGGAFAGLAASGLLRSMTPAEAAAVSDTDILNFALNLEYLEAEYYLRASSGMGLAASDTSGTGTKGTVTGGSAVPFKSERVAQLAAEIASNEKDHVEFLRAALGSYAVAEPSIDLYNSFNAAAVAAGLGESFNPFADDISFLLGAYIFEDVGVTAYNGAAPLITSKTYLGAAASILAVEAYHAGCIRSLLSEFGEAKATAKISALRASASDAADDQGVSLNGMINIFPVNSNALAFSRTTTQVLNIVYLGGASANYGFFPQGLNGSIA
jgi:hypothetical protein